MLNEYTSLLTDKRNKERVCSICKKEITEDDLVHITDNLTVHFKCYIEIQNKMCASCGRPFKDQEILLYCDEHKEYFHEQGVCFEKHLEKHMPFKYARYDASRNRITFLDTKEKN